jgi:putative glutamine amidotransferase
MISPLPPPVIGIPACVREFNELPFHTVSDKYVAGVVNGVGGLPLLIPAAGTLAEMAPVVQCLDGLLITGSPSNVEPHHYGGEPSREGTLHDPCRDATTLPLIRAALAAGVPVFAICRGHQELNVALGGSLHQLVHELPGKLDHRGNRELPRLQRYEPRHSVHLTPGGLIARIAGTTEILVNSLHAQAIDRLADRLIVEAVADDGTIEAVRVKDALSFALGVQWHPEWRIVDDPVSRGLFDAFRDAARAHVARRLSSSPAGRAA